MKRKKIGTHPNLMWLVKKWDVSLICLLILVIPSVGLAAKKKPLSESERLYRSKCASCHRLLPPKKYSDEKWEEYVIKYGKKLKEEEKQRILEYLKEAN